MTLKKSKRRGLIRQIHKWPSIVLLLFILVFVVSGVVMNHRSLFSTVDVNREYLLEEYRYMNWNNAAVKGACRLGGDSLLIFGNIGIWLTDTNLRSFSDFNQGFPEGIDNRKIFQVYRTRSGELFAATLFGLFRYQYQASEWIHLKDKRVVDIVEAEDRIYILTRSYLFEIVHVKDHLEFREIILPPPIGYQNRVSLFKTLWVIHSGEIGGFVGKLIVDVMGLLFAFLSITGIIYWLFPKWIKRRKRAKKGILRIKIINVFSLKWHNKIGVWAVLFLIMTTLTGMFLRPPLLIAIATAQVGKIPFSLLDDENPWFDQLRRIMYDDEKKAFLVGTNNGIYFADASFETPLLHFPNQPPTSVMGINVFEQINTDQVLVGSFNGLFIWDPYRGFIRDYYNPHKSVARNPSGPPLSENMTSGYIRISNNKTFVFDYNRGLETLQSNISVPKMPEKMIAASPMSLWNLALEFHTARYYSFIFGSLYILFIPLFGISMLSILITGFLLWWKKYR